MTTNTKGQFGRVWRVLAHRDGGRFEVENQGTLDELVVDQWLHIEQMQEDIWWLRVGDARLLVTLDPQGGPPTLDIERGFYAEPKGTTKTRE